MSSLFGTTAGGAPARAFDLSGADGLRVKVTDFGAAIVEVHVPDRTGASADVVLGFDAVDGYESPANPYFGATIGRVANRIAGGSFDLHGRRYDLAANEPPHHLHGGAQRSFDKVLWDVVREDDRAVELAHVSPAGEEGYPGRVEASATYRVDGRDLVVEYRAVSDETTPVNMTNHAYWNLHGAGRGTILDHRLQIHADAYTVADDELIPTGEVAEVAGTALDFRNPAPVGARIDELTGTGALGYDHNFVLRGPAGRLRPAARLHDPASGRVMELLTTQPGLQLYSGNRIFEPIRGKGGATYGRYAGLCLEPQHHPDALHHPQFPSILLEPGRTYEHVSVFRFPAD